MNKNALVIRGEKLILSPQKACFWESKSTLLLSDLHLGKAGHFRKHGIPISKKVHLADLTNLEALLIELKPVRVLLLGDLFHSYKNLEWLDFIQFLKSHDTIEFILIKGNHDILQEYPQKLHVVHRLEDPPFLFTHHQEESELYNISGHIHPGVTIRGRARQGITMPCFWFKEDHAVMPAFGQFTGIKKISPAKTDKVFAIADQRVIEIR